LACVILTLPFSQHQQALGLSRRFIPERPRQPWQTSCGDAVWAEAQRIIKLPVAAFLETGLPFPPRNWDWAG
jgi:hypothetical protein